MSVFVCAWIRVCMYVLWGGHTTKKLQIEP